MNRRLLRRLYSDAMVGLMILAVVLAVLPLLLILGTLISKGASNISLEFFTRLPVPAGETGGGVAHAIIGTLVIVGAACLIGLPLGILSGIYCAEYPAARLAWVTRFVADVMNGTPSIVVGVFAWAWIVSKQGHFSALAGSAALAMLMIPMVMRTTEEMIKLVPHSLREAALALGYSRWRTSLSVVVRTSLPGIVTGSLLSVARIAGETAPLLSRHWGVSTPQPDEPMAALPLVVFNYATATRVAPAGVVGGPGPDPGGAGAQHRCPAGHAAEIRSQWLIRRRGSGPRNSRRCTGSSPP
jgi:phosphate transport system permease protein